MLWSSLVSLAVRRTLRWRVRGLLLRFMLFLAGLSLTSLLTHLMCPAPGPLA